MARRAQLNANGVHRPNAVPRVFNQHQCSRRSFVSEPEDDDTRLVQHAEGEHRAQVWELA